MADVAENACVLRTSVARLVYLGLCACVCFRDSCTTLLSTCAEGLNSCNTLLPACVQRGVQYMQGGGAVVLVYHLPTAPPSSAFWPFAFCSILVLQRNKLGLYSPTSTPCETPFVDIRGTFQN